MAETTSRAHAPEHLMQALSRLAQEPEAQIKYLREIGVAPSADELALELNDALPTLTAMVESGELSAAIAERIRALDNKLDSLSGPQQRGIWNIDALGTAPEWDQIRQMAGVILASLSG